MQAAQTAVVQQQMQRVEMARQQQVLAEQEAKFERYKQMRQAARQKAESRSSRKAIRGSSSGTALAKSSRPVGYSVASSR
jgi:hypothetical protein